MAKNKVKSTKGNKKDVKKKSSTKKSLKKEQQGPRFSLKEFIIIALVFLALVLIAWIVNSLQTYFLTANVFTVKKISTNESINYDLKKQNIFKVDLDKLEKEIRLKHPEFKSLRVSRSFPDVIDVHVVKRIPVFQIDAKSYYLLDKEAVVIAGPSDVPYEQILVRPAMQKKRSFRLGDKIEIDNFNEIMELLALLKRYSESKIYMIKELRIPSLNQMNFIIENIEIRIGEGNYAHKIEILFERILPQYNHDFEKIEYIDLRFNDYVIGYKK